LCHRVRGKDTHAIEAVDEARYLGVSGDVSDVTGAYFSAFSEETPCEAARDDETARRLWEVSEELVDLADDLRLSPSTETP
jgi:hypothetical protein